MKTVRVVSLSGGAPSALVAIRAVQTYKLHELRFVFADTKAEHEDNYRFLLDVEARLGKRIKRLKDGRTPLQVAEDENYVPTQAFATCTFRLKTDLIKEYVAGLQAKGYRVEMLIGYDLSDRTRVANTARAWASEGVVARFPLIEDGVTNPKAEIVKLGLRLPVTYEMGFKHANCLGAAQGGCVKFGKKDTILVIENFPERHAIKEEWEWEQVAKRRFVRLLTWWLWAKVCPALFHMKPPVKTYTFLRDATGDYPDGLTLREFRQQYELAVQKKQRKLFTLEADLTGTCTTECGVSGIEE